MKLIGTAVDEVNWYSYRSETEELLASQEVELECQWAVLPTFWKNLLSALSGLK
jgi:hypothetical protein